MAQACDGADAVEEFRLFHGGAGRDKLVEF
jgi:hypothetical protein